MQEPQRYGVAGPVAVLALIVAVAFAGVPAVAQPVATTSASLVQKVKKALGLARKANARSVKAIKIARSNSGPEGPAGSAGAKGDKGDTGAKGADGAKGDKGDKGDTGAKGTFSNEPLPSGESLHGVWAVTGDESIKQFAVFSYPMRVEPAPSVMAYITPGEEAITIDPTTGAVIGFELPPEEYEVFCPGTAAEPAAAPGNLCVYTEAGSTAFFTFVEHFLEPAFGKSPDPTSGAQLRFTPEENYAKGPWVVTAE